jgi:hypothetical protein
MVYIIIDGQRMSEEEYQEHRRQIEEAEQRSQDEAARLVRQLSEAYKAYSEFMEQNPGVCQRVGDAEAREHELYEKLRRNLEKADEAPRCEKVREDGTICGSPQMKGYRYCYAHERMAAARAEKLELPPLEDANAIQMAVMLVQRALIDDEITEKKAGLLLYSLQIAASNVDKTTFGEEEDEYLVTEAPEEMLAAEARRRGEGGEEFRRRLPQMSADGRNSTTETQRRGEESGPRTLPLMSTNDPGLMPVKGEAIASASECIDRSTARRHADAASLRSR